MINKIMKWVSKHILLAPFMFLMIVVFCSCKSQIAVMPSEKHELTVTQRKVQIDVPPAEASIFAQIKYDKGKYYLKEFQRVTNENLHLKMEMDSLGNIKILAKVPPRKVDVMVNDSTKTSIYKEVQYVEKKLNVFEKFCIIFTLFCFGSAITILIVKLYNRFN